MYWHILRTSKDGSNSHVAYVIGSKEQVDTYLVVLKSWPAYKDSNLHYSEVKFIDLNTSVDLVDVMRVNREITELEAQLASKKTQLYKLILKYS